MRYLRFGNVPENGKSINFLKLTNSQNEDFTYDCEVESYEYAVSKLPEYVFENGVSVFEIDENGLPKLCTLRLVSSMLSRINLPVYEISGKQVGTGNDGEPIIKVEKVDKKRRIGQEKLVNHVISTLCKYFKNAEFNKDFYKDSCELYSFYVENKINIKTGEIVSIWNEVDGNDWVKMPPYTEYKTCGWTFSNPVDGFDVNIGTRR